MKARDSFDAAPPRTPGRVKRFDLHLKVTEVDIPAVLDEQGAEVTPATTEMVYHDRYEYNIPDDSGGGSDPRAGPLRPHLTPARKTSLKNLLDYLFARANGA